MSERDIVITQERLERFSERGSHAVDAALRGFEVASNPEIIRNTREKTGAHDLVTDGDKAAQRVIFDFLNDRFPDDSFLGEEENLSRVGTSGHQWVIDPIDGTTNYANYKDPWAVSVGGVENGSAVRGAIITSRGDRFYAEAGKGAYKNGRKIHVSSVTDLDRAKIDTDSPSNKLKRKINFLILGDLAPSANVRGSLVANAASVAEGSSDLYYCAGFGGPWDIAAAIPIVQEAGGVVYDLIEGRNLTRQKDSYSAKSIVFGNDRLVSQFIKATRGTLERFKTQ